jgi:ribosomal protein S18 acetylase RimI-like enzyme
VVEIRPARPGDDRALVTIDRATWTSATSPAPPPPEPDWRFFDERVEICDVLVAELEGEVVGYVRLGRRAPVPASDHVLAINGIAVGPAAQGRGVGRALLDAAIAEARNRGGRKLTLRVLAPNLAARRLYDSAGFVVEGVLHEEFRLEGRYVDDVLMALDLTAAVS